MSNLAVVELFCVTDVHGMGKLIPKHFLRVSLVHSQKVPYEGAQLHKNIPARKPCVTEVLCNWKFIPK